MTTNPFSSPVATLPGSFTCEEAMRAIVEGCAESIDAELSVFLTGDDESGPHKTRVALRRLTTCLDAFAPLMRKAPLAMLRHEAKSIFRDLGQVRDSDVFLAGLSDPDQRENHLKANRKLREMTRKRLRKRRVVTFAPRLRLAVAIGSALFRTRPKAVQRRQTPLRDFASQALAKVWVKCRRHGPSVRAMSVGTRHDFRKDMKTLRYLSEFFSDLFPILNQNPFRADFRALQDALGLLNDFEVSLALQKRKRRPDLPLPQQRAMAEAEVIWVRLSSTQPPWAGPNQDTREP